MQHHPKYRKTFVWKTNAWGHCWSQKSWLIWAFHDKNQVWTKWTSLSMKGWNSIFHVEKLEKLGLVYIFNQSSLRTYLLFDISLSDSGRIQTLNLLIMSGVLYHCTTVPLRAQNHIKDIRCCLLLSPFISARMQKEVWERVDGLAISQWCCTTQNIGKPSSERLMLEGTANHK